MGLCLSLSAQHLRVVALQCNALSNPLGVDVASPKLSWKIQSDQKWVSQVAYQIYVSSDPNFKASKSTWLWDSKKTTTATSINVGYNGLALKSGQMCYWKVKVWDSKGNVATSAVAHWQMGVLKNTDWAGAKWIALEKLADTLVNPLPTDGQKDRFKGNNTLPIFRKSFDVKKKIKQATIFISGLGQLELSCNGQKVSNDFLAPGWTKYDKEALYVTYDVTQQLQLGQNTLGIMLGNGFYYIPPVSGRYRKLKVAFGYPKVICRLLIEYVDGSTANVVSDASWKTAPSPITFSSIYGGEDYNANLAQKDWDKSGFDDKAWRSVLLVDGPHLHAQKEEPVKVMQRFEPISSNNLPNGQQVFDFGQNASAIVEIKVKGKKGDTVKVKPAELLNSDGSVNQKNSGSPYYFTYVLKGGGEEVWRPRFTYYGFRYAQVSGPLTSIQSLHIRNAAPTVGSFACSNPLFNQAFGLIDWAVKSNMVSVFTDCPHREKLGWLEQLHLMGSSIRYNYDALPLFKKAMADMRNSQLENGLVPEIAPEYVKFEWGGNDMFRDSPEWGSSSIILPWYLYQWYGDKSVLEDNYGMMQRYLTYLAGKAEKHLLKQGLGDWYDLGPKAPGVSQLTPMGVTGTAIYYYDLTIAQKVATLLGKADDAVKYKSLANQIRTAFNNEFFNPNTKQYATGSQTANAMAVYMGLVAQKDKQAVIDNLIKDIRDRNNALTAGDIGYRYVLRVLEAAGRSDVIFEMNNRSDVPGYGMQLAKGATALTESWQALPTVSNNHLMLGHLMEWFYSGLLGIRQDTSSLAFKKIIIAPRVVGNITWAKGAYQSPYGKIVSNWQKSKAGFELDVEIPANTTATIFLPASANAKIEEKNRNVFKLLGFENGCAKLAVGSGYYQFKTQ